MARDYETTEEFKKETIEDLKADHTKRVCIGLCLDTSGSMRGNPITALRQAINKFYLDIEGDNVLRYAAEIGIVRFSTDVEVISNFSTVEMKEPLEELHAEGWTALGKGTQKMVEMLKERNSEYRTFRTPHYHPWLIIFSDGIAENDDDKLRERMQKETRRLEEEEKYVILPVALGDYKEKAELDKYSRELSKFSSKHVVLQIDMNSAGSYDFKQFFTFLSESVTGSIGTQGSMKEADPIEIIEKTTQKSKGFELIQMDDDED